MHWNLGIYQDVSSLMGIVEVLLLGKGSTSWNYSFGIAEFKSLCTESPEVPI